MPLHHEIIFFGGFILVIVSVLLIDLLLIGRERHVLSIKEASVWTMVWVLLAVSFYFLILLYGDKLHNINNINDLHAMASKYGVHLNFKSGSFSSLLKAYRNNMATEFITGYLVEYTLSLDNVFVILLILTGFSIPPKSYKVVLFWGILGAIILRCIFIFLGAALVQQFQWTLIVFGLFLIYSAVKIFIERKKEESIEVKNHPMVRFASKWFRVAPGLQDDKFFVKEKGLLYITPLFIVLIIIEFTDLIFAFDSIPAIFSVTRDPYIVFFSNIFAIIGLRSLFFLIIKIFNLFTYLKEGISILLLFIGLKLVFHQWLEHIGYKSAYSLYFILAILTGSILISIVFPRKKNPGT